MQPIKIDYFTDILCIWAYISQTRMDELSTEFDKNIIIHARFFPVFGHAKKKIDAQWSAKGGRRGYAEHVHHEMKDFEHINLHEDIWVKNTPESSLPAHLYLTAIKLLEQQDQLQQGLFAQMTKTLRQAFFSDCLDISNTATLLSLFEENKIPIALIENSIKTGAAFAALSEDMKLASEMTVRASPTIIFNEDRQRLTGNVGYRIIQANTRELLYKPENQHSWC